jgi:hypothetical protein
LCVADGLCLASPDQASGGPGRTIEHRLHKHHVAELKYRQQQHQEERTKNGKFNRRDAAFSEF